MREANGQSHATQVNKIQDGRGTTSSVCDSVKQEMHEKSTEQKVGVSDPSNDISNTRARKKGWAGEGGKSKRWKSCVRANKKTVAKRADQEREKGFWSRGSGQPEGKRRSRPVMERVLGSEEKEGLERISRTKALLRYNKAGTSKTSNSRTKSRGG